VKRPGMLLVFAIGCNVDPVAEDGCGATVEAEPGCPAAAVVVMSDFISSQVALTRLDGTTLCGSFASSARSEASSLAFPFSGDLAVPTTAPASGEVVLIDRFGTNVVSFLDPPTGNVLRQLAIGTGFQSNPQDYLEVDGRRAFVTRWGENPLPGVEPFDGGGDVLVIDRSEPAVVARIELPRSEGFPPRPAGMTLVDGVVMVTLQRASVDVKTMGEAEIVGIDPDSEAIVFTERIAGLKNCGPLTPSPSAERAVVACTGFIDPDGISTDLAESAIVVFDLAETPPVELGRFAAIDVAGAPLQSNVAFFGEERLVVKTQSALGGETNNRVLSLDLVSGETQGLLEARPATAGGGQGIVYGGLLCTPGCGDVCLLADADHGALQRWSIAEGELESLPLLRVTGTVGLPPRDLGTF